MGLSIRDRSNAACDLGSEGCVLHPRCFDEGRGAMTRHDARSAGLLPWHMHYDWCAKPDHDIQWLEPVSDHRYRYSMAIGDAWSVSVSNAVLRNGSWSIRNYDMRKGTTYEYGYDAPRYPVPAVVETGFIPLYLDYFNPFWY